MKQLRLYGIEDMRCETADIPDPNPREILVRVRACGVCATDLRKYTYVNYKPLRLPRNTGHEWTGEVVAVGSEVSRFVVGDRVAAEGEGGFAEYAVISEHDLGFAQALPTSVSYEEGTLVEPLADCLHALVNRACVRLGESVVVLGAGVMGLLLCGAASVSGARVAVSEPDPNRRALALEFGAQRAYDPADDDLEEQVRGWGGGALADICVASIGAAPVVQQSVRLVGPRGRVVLFGGAQGDPTVPLDINRIHYQELSILGSEWVGTASYGDPRMFELSVRLIAERLVPVGRLITHRLGLEEIRQAFDLMRDRSALKVVLQTGGER